MLRAIFNKPQVSTGPPGTPFAWYDPSDTSSLTVSAGLVSQMNDKSGNLRHVTASGIQRPTSGAATINGLNVLSGFTGTVVLASANITQAQPITIYAVAQRTGNAANMQITGNTSAATPTLFDFNNKWTIYAGTILASATTDDLVAHVFGALFSGASSVLKLDNATIVSGNAGASGLAANPIAIGNGIPSSFPFLGTIGEVIYYLTDPGTVHAYLKAKWGTP